MISANEVRSVASSTLPLATPQAVFVVDNDALAREAMAVSLRRYGLSVKVFPSAEAFLVHPLGLTPTCLVLNTELPGITGLELQKRLLTERPSVSVIFVTANNSIPMTVQAMKAGAFEFLTKPVCDEMFLPIVASALERSRILCNREEELSSLATRYARLTMREREVLALVVSGLANKQVGDQLGISEITVKQHRGNVMKKMCANSLPQLVKMAFRLRTTKTVSRPGGGRVSSQPPAVSLRVAARIGQSSPARLGTFSFA